jgi:acyl-CoA oxidase
VINTPTLGATKWWPGALGQAANHAVVYAKLIIDGQDKGLHSFLV